MFVLNERAMGGSSVKPGRIELCINRKAVGHDAGGITQALRQYGEIEVEFWLHFEWRKEQDNEVIGLKEYFGKLLRKSSEIANPLQFLRYDGSFKATKKADQAESLAISRSELVSYLRTNGIYDLRIFPMMQSVNLEELTML